MSAEMTAAADEALEPLYNSEDLEQLWGFSRFTIERLRRSGKLGYYKVSGQIRFSRRQIHEYLERCRVDATAA